PGTSEQGSGCRRDIESSTGRRRVLSDAPDRHALVDHFGKPDDVELQLFLVGQAEMRTRRCSEHRYRRTVSRDVARIDHVLGEGGEVAAPGVAVRVAADK